MGVKFVQRGGMVLLVAVLLVAGGTWGYINLARQDAPERLTLESSASDPNRWPATAARQAEPTTGAAAPGIDAVWKVSTGSEGGYRVPEVLFEQGTEAVGRTGDVSGSITIAGVKVTSGSFTVDMTTVTSDESRRDNQFRGRIMSVSTHPRSTFELAQPIDFGSLPPEGTQVEVPATGNLTLRGTTKTVTFSVQAQRTSNTIKIAGTVPIVFEEWGIPNPSFGPARTGDEGVLEFLLVLGR